MRRHLVQIVNGVASLEHVEAPAPKIYTASSITDEQIRAIRDRPRALEEEPPIVNFFGESPQDYARGALGEIDLPTDERAWYRERCAEILNERAAHDEMKGTST